MRYELSDYEWTAIKPMLPNLHSGAPRRDLLETYGSRTTCDDRFVRWRRAGVWDQIMEARRS